MPRAHNGRTDVLTENYSPRSGILKLSNAHARIRRSRSAGWGRGAYGTRGIGDAPVQQAPKPTWLVIPAPDGFGNVATVCNPAQKGTRLYIVTHGKADVQPLVQADEACR
jgi:hypothetical protein